MSRGSAVPSRSSASHIASRLDFHGGTGFPTLYPMLTGGEAASPVKVVLIAGVIGCVVGLKLVG
ncbi:hypothetical protein I553_0432 [Mycobacterium xenopi 4042]|uniref:Uncharacterized protein n=1 Tax=Mycobacterium xenopi 4042 TaxID=1299334 RepID=X7YIB8_MYCXE|nr:hypothetical protein I553_0432 [Mycobacterium xenopi 4042]EUA19276.1 hypothetical protein I552_9019 [Mycobacterium xenopi 3993]